MVWLYANNRVAEAEQIIRNAAKLNNITMPDKILARSYAAKISVDGTDDRGSKLLEEFHSPRNSDESENKKDVDARYTIIDLFRNRRLTINLFCMAFCWSVLPIYCICLSFHLQYEVVV